MIRSVWVAVAAIGIAFPAADAAPDSARRLPKLELKLIDGTWVRPADLAGRVTVIDFWGTWCKPCLEEVPDYNAFYSTYKDKGVRFIAVAVESGTEEDLRRAVKRLDIRYPVAAPPLEVLDRFGPIDVFPTTRVFNRQGRLEKEFVGNSPTKHKVLREVVDRLLR